MTKQWKTMMKLMPMSRMNTYSFPKSIRKFLVSPDVKRATMEGKNKDHD